MKREDRGDSGDWVDVTLSMHSGMVTWPGDPPVRVEPTATLEHDGVALTRVEVGSHTGTHVDAPCHFVPGAGGVDALALDRLIGPCRVLDLTHVTDRIRHADLMPADIHSGERLLLRTRHGALLPSGQFNPNYVALDAQAARLLAERDVALVGIDALSIDPYQEPGHPAHHILLERGIVVLEGVDLAAVIPGAYDLIALPLRLADADGAPTRVLLRRRSGG